MQEMQAKCRKRGLWQKEYLYEKSDLNEINPFSKVFVFKSWFYFNPGCGGVFTSWYRMWIRFCLCMGVLGSLCSGVGVWGLGGLVWGDRRMKEVARPGVLMAVIPAFLGQVNALPCLRLHISHGWHAAPRPTLIHEALLCTTGCHSVSGSKPEYERKFNAREGRKKNHDF